MKIRAYSAALLHFTAYAIYLYQVGHSISDPNAASWTVWAFLSALNAFSFWKTSRSAEASAQFFTGAVMCIVVYAFSVATGSFKPISNLEVGILISCLLACLAWYLTESPALASLMAGTILAVSFYPTIMGVAANPAAESPLPWFLWTAAFSVTLYNAWKLRRMPGREMAWTPVVLYVPLIGIVAHAAVGSLALI